MLPRYNGNIAEVDWRTGTVQGDNLRRYGYVYDRLNRLSAGFYQADSNPSAKEYFEKVDYDLNGNISHLKRSASKGQNIMASAIDNLTYVYASGNASNRLVSVTDSSWDYRGYPDTSGIAIPYDNNGNITSHEDKGILQIRYNFLNLPDYLKFNKYVSRRGQMYYVNTNYTYRADGVKLSKRHNYFIGNTSIGAVKHTDYLDGFQYSTDQNLLISPDGALPMDLQFVPTAEGYYDFVKNKYIYNYEDHLGNVRLSYFNNGSITEVLEENNYYPFGLKHEGYNPLAGNSAYQYKYNGKELQTESGMYDYGARFYMPDIGRWGVVDPLAEKMTRHSPYNYAFNNPIRFIDPDGRSGKDWVGTTDANGSTTWHWDKDIKSASQAAAAGYDSYSDGKTNNTYTSISLSEVTLKTEGNWSEDFTSVNETTLGAAQAKMFGRYAFGISVNGSYGNITKSYSLAYNLGTEQFRIFETDGVKLGSESPGDIGFSVFQMNAYGEKDGAKYTNVFEGATGYSTEVSGSYFFGGAHSFSATDNSPGRADYGTQATSFNLGTDYDAGVSRTFTKDVTKQVNNAPSAVGNWLRRNIKYSPEIN